MLTVRKEGKFEKHNDCVSEQQYFGIIRSAVDLSSRRFTVDSKRFFLNTSHLCVGVAVFFPRMME
jgi:hypothetical protein